MKNNNNHIYQPETQLQVLVGLYKYYNAYKLVYITEHIDKMDDDNLDIENLFSTTSIDDLFYNFIINIEDKNKAVYFKLLDKILLRIESLILATMTKIDKQYLNSKYEAYYQSLSIPINITEEEIASFESDIDLGIHAVYDIYNETSRARNLEASIDTKYVEKRPNIKPIVILADFLYSYHVDGVDEVPENTAGILSKYKVEDIDTIDQRVVNSLDFIDIVILGLYLGKITFTIVREKLVGSITGRLSNESN